LLSNKSEAFVPSVFVTFVIERMFDLRRFLSPERRAIDLEIGRFLDGQASSEVLIQTIARQPSIAERAREQAKVDPPGQVPSTEEFLSQLRESIEDEPGDSPSHGHGIKP
jgi:hypothetical protein